MQDCRWSPELYRHYQTRPTAVQDQIIHIVVVPKTKSAKLRTESPLYFPFPKLASGSRAY
jgi:hypothetical protein